MLPPSRRSTLHGALTLSLAWVVLGLLGLPSCGAHASSRHASASILLGASALESLDTLEVDVRSIALHRRDGFEQALLPRPVRFDFADATPRELIARADIDPGAYDRITMDLDFSAATAVLVGSAEPARLTDPFGRPLGRTTVQITFGERSTPLFTRNRNHAVELVLDLDQARIDRDRNAITVLPVIGADVAAATQRPVTVNGRIGDADTANGTLICTAGSDLTVAVSPNARIQIDGEILTGSNGLLALSEPSRRSAARIRGHLANDHTRLIASAIEVGTVAARANRDHIDGWIIGRRGAAGADATLTVLGTSYDATTGQRAFDSTMHVRVAHGVTRVRRHGDDLALSTDTLAVGGHVAVFGTRIDANTLDANGSRALVQASPVELFGRAIGPVTEGVLHVRVVRFGDRVIDRFAFDLADETRPRTYAIDVAGLPDLDVGAGTKIRALGVPAPLGSGSAVDFFANAVTSTTTDGKVLICDWEPAADPAVLAIGNDRLSPDISTVSRGSLGDEFESLDLSITSGTTPVVLPGTTASSFRIVSGSKVDVFADYAVFASRCRQRYVDGAKVVRLSAVGSCDSTQLFSADVITVVLD